MGTSSLFVGIKFEDAYVQLLFVLIRNVRILQGSPTFSERAQLETYFNLERETEA